MPGDINLISCFILKFKSQKFYNCFFYQYNFQMEISFRYTRNIFAT